MAGEYPGYSVRFEKGTADGFLFPSTSGPIVIDGSHDVTLTAKGGAIRVKLALTHNDETNDTQPNLVLTFTDESPAGAPAPKAAKKAVKKATKKAAKKATKKATKKAAKKAAKKGAGKK